MAEKNMNAKISVEFEETANRQQLSSGDNLPTLFGKIKKVISDLSTSAFSGSYNDLSDVPDVVTKEYVDPVKSQAALNRTTLGYQRKNLLKNTATTKTTNGITFTVNDDKSITVNGTNILDKGVSIEICGLTDFGNRKLTASIGTADENVYLALYNSRWSWIGTNESGVLTWDNKESRRVRLIVKAGATVNNVTVYPMIRYADIIDDTYEPYKESVDERLINNTCDIVLNKSTLGYQCKNLLKNNAVTQTVNGVTFTVNTDGSVTVNGTNTSSSTGANLEICGFKNYGDIKLTASLKSTDSNVYISVFDKNWVGVGIICDNEVTWDNDNKERYVRLVVKPGATVNNVTVYPMLRYADITDDTYEPYQPSLQEQITALEERIAALGG